MHFGHPNEVPKKLHFGRVVFGKPWINSARVHCFDQVFLEKECSRASQSMDSWRWPFQGILNLDVFGKIR
jgi:hypothetical protein